MRRVFVLALVLSVVVAAQGLNLQQAARQVQAQIKGRVLGGKTLTEDDRTVHVIRVLTPDGRVRHIRVDARSGRIIAPASARKR